MTKFQIDSLHGVVSPVATPVNKDETVDEGGLRRLVNFQLERGVHGLFVLGGTGEFFCFPTREKIRAIETVVDEVNGRVPVVAGVTDLSTRRAIENSHIAQEAGVDFITSLPPFFFPLGQDTMSRFYTSLAGESDLPLLLYNIRDPIHTNIQPETVQNLAENPRIVGIKDSEDYAHVQQVVFLTQDKNFKVFDGLESHFYASVNVGAAGGVLSAANFCPRLCCDIYDASVTGDHFRAQELQAELNRLLSDLIGFSSWWGVVKASLSLLGLCDRQVTHPMATCTEDETKRLHKILSKFSLL